VRPRPAQSGRGCEHDGSPRSVGCLELRARRHDALVDVPTYDELGSRGGERGQHAVAVLERELPRSPPGRAGEVVMECNDS